MILNITLRTWKSCMIPVSYTHLDVYKRQYKDFSKTIKFLLVAHCSVQFILLTILQPISSPDLNWLHPDDPGVMASLCLSQYLARNFVLESIVARDHQQILFFPWSFSLLVNLYRPTPILQLRFPQNVSTPRCV